MESFDYAVVGKGLIGSAAASALSETEGSVAVVGPDEPRQPRQHRGVFASHYDQGRITRLIGRDVLYSRLAELAIDRYAEIEAGSGIRFHSPVGMIIAETPTVPDGHMKRPLATARELARQFTLYEPPDRSWKGSFPFFDFPASYRLIHEPAPAGFINPRAMVSAQLKIAETNGATVIRETVLRVVPDGEGFELVTEQGRRLRAGRVVVSAGAFTQCHALIPHPLAFEAETETILLARVGARDATRLKDAPVVIYLVDDPEIWDAYMTPPMRYPDGYDYIKIGANSIYDERLDSLEAIGRWFRTGDSDRSKDALARTVRSLWPGLELSSFHTNRCILSKTPSGYPMVDELAPGWFVAAGGNGGSAKSADALGRLAAALMLERSWPDAIPRDALRAQPAE